MVKEKLLGSKKDFAIQYELTGFYNQIIYGKICYWIQGKQIGSYEEIILSDILLFLPTIIKDNGNRKHESFFIMEMDKLIHLLSGAAFLEGNVKIEEKANEEKWARFDISIPIDTFGDTFIFLIDSEENSRLIFTDNAGKYFQTYIKRGYVDKVFLQLYNELNLIYSEKCC